MRWIWIDRITEFTPAEQLTAVKSVSRCEEYLGQQFGDERGAYAVMPASLMIEGMAQSAGILVGSTRGFAEKVILAKIVVVELEREVVPGETIRYRTTIDRIDEQGAATTGTVEVLSPGCHGSEGWTNIGRIDLMFSHVDQNISGLEFPEFNFVFDTNLEAILATFDHPALELPKEAC